MSGRTRIEQLEARIKDLEAQAERVALHSDAIRRFQTTGPTAAPMTAHHVAAVLGFTQVKSVHTAVCDGRLRRRWDALAGFHPDDVRAFIQKQKGNQGDAVRRRWAKQKQAS